LSIKMAMRRVSTEKTNPPAKTHEGMGFEDTNFPITMPAKANLLISMRYLAIYSRCFGARRMSTV